MHACIAALCCAARSGAVIALGAAWLPLAVQAQLNLGFETDAVHGGVPGWRGGDDSFALDATFAFRGDSSLRVASDGDGRRSGFSQEIAAQALRGDRIRIAAYVKVEPGSAAVPTLRVRIDGRGGLLYISRETNLGTPEESGWQRLTIDAPLTARAERLSFGGEVSGRGRVWFDEFSVTALDARELPPPSAAAERYVRDALAVIDEHAATRSSIDWATYRASVLTQARGAGSVDEAHLAVRFALAELGDHHSYFMSPQQMARLQDDPVGNARTARPARAPEATLLPGGVGYLRLPGIAGGEHTDRVVFAETVQQLIAEIDAGAACGWILDLRGNQGGNLWPMLAGVGPLLGDGDIAYSSLRDGERRRIWYADGKAGLGDFVQLRVRGDAVQLRDPVAPVAVVLDDDTASAAEIIAVAFAGRERSRSFGRASAGATSATRTFPMRDGAALILAVAGLTDRHGREIVGPILPDEPTAGGQDLPREEQADIAAARRWLRRVSAAAGGPCEPAEATAAADGIRSGAALAN